MGVGEGTMVIRAVMFDFGGVISSSPFEAFARFEAERNLPPDFIRTVNATNPDANAWAQLERSEVDIDAFVALWTAEALLLGHELAHVVQQQGVAPQPWTGSVEWDAASATEREADRLDFAKRLRADGDRLASEGRWKDAIARYDQAVPYDQKGELERETQERRRAMREHGGEVKPGTEVKIVVE